MEISQDFDSHENKSNWLARVTIGDALFALIVLGTAVLRLYNLAAIPLADSEALQALAVWHFWQPSGMADAAGIGSPLYFALTAPLSQLVGFSDVTMRLVPAFFGIALVVLPRFLQHRIGAVGVLVASLALAVSPLNMLLSRTVGGDAAALSAILLIAIAFIRYQETAASKWLYTLAAAVGLGMTTSTLFYSGLITLVIAGLIQSKFGMALFENESLVKPEVPERNTAVIIGILVFLLSATLFLWNFIGIGDAARLLGDWFSTIFATTDRAIADPLFALGRYEPMLLVLGIPTIIWTVWRSKSFATANLYWLMTILLLIVIRRGDMTTAALVTIPGYLLIGMFAQMILAGQVGKNALLVGIGFFVAFGVIAINIGRYVRAATYAPQEIQFLLIALLTIIVIFMTVYMLAMSDVSAIYQGTILALLTFYVVVQWGIAFQMANYYANDPRERWVTAGTDEGVHVLARTVLDISRQVTGGTEMLDAISVVDSPVLAWYLRDLKGLQLGSALPATAVHDVIITPENANIPFTDSYTGTKIRFQQVGVNDAPPNPDTLLFDMLRWWFFHESVNQVIYNDLIVWVRADLIEQ